MKQEESNEGCHLPPVNVLSDFDLGWKGLVPDFVPFFEAWHREMDNGLESTDESIVYVGALVGSQYHQPVVTFDALRENQRVRVANHCA